MWYRAGDAKTIVIAMPEINESNMLGFLNADNKLKRLDQRSDLCSMLDIIKGACGGLREISATKTNENIEQLIAEYTRRLASRDNCAVPILPDNQGYFLAEICDVYDDPQSAHRFCLIRGLRKVVDSVADEESHWICDWDKRYTFTTGDCVKFRVKSTEFKKSIRHGGKVLVNLRNITPEADIEVSRCAE